MNLIIALVVLIALVVIFELLIKPEETIKRVVRILVGLFAFIVILKNLWPYLAKGL